MDVNWRDEKYLVPHPTGTIVEGLERAGFTVPPRYTYTHTHHLHHHHHFRSPIHNVAAYLTLLSAPYTVLLSDENESQLAECYRYASITSVASPIASAIAYRSRALEGHSGFNGIERLLHGLDRSQGFSALRSGASVVGSPTKASS